jgi:transglutaminase-like putative cysteine protease
MGFPIPELPSGKISGYHCWADFYTENEGWTPVDISEADKHPEKEDYYFGTICENRIEMSVGRDIVLKGYEENPVNFLIYPRVEIDDVNAKSYTYKISYKNL